MGAGERWKVRREAMGKTLDDVSSDLRVSRKYLRGIEEGNFEGWPERVFSTGFIRSYAKLLGEDAEPVLAEYFAFIGEQRNVASAPPPPAPSRPEWLQREKERGSRMTAYAVAAVIVLGIGALLAWYSNRTARTDIPAPPVAQVPVPVPADNAASGAAGDNVSRIDNGAVTDNAAAPDNASPADVRAPAPAQENAATVADREEPVEGIGPVPPPYQLFLEANAQTWLLYSPDGGTEVEVMLNRGEKFSIQARRSIYLKLGNAGGVIGTLNGKALPPFGGSGQVKVFRLGEGH